MVIKCGLQEQGSSEPAATSVWRHPVFKTLHHKVLDWFAVSQSWEVCTTATVHTERTRSDHLPVLLQREAREEFIMVAPPRPTPPRR